MACYRVSGSKIVILSSLKVIHILFHILMGNFLYTAFAFENYPLIILEYRYGNRSKKRKRSQPGTALNTGVFIILKYVYSLFFLTQTRAL
jgi:hypothetical protein